MSSDNQSGIDAVGSASVTPQECSSGNRFESSLVKAESDQVSASENQAEIESQDAFSGVLPQTPKQVHYDVHEVSDSDSDSGVRPQTRRFDLPS